MGEDRDFRQYLEYRFGQLEQILRNTQAEIKEQRLQDRDHLEQKIKDIAEQLVDSLAHIRELQLFMRQVKWAWAPLSLLAVAIINAYGRVIVDWLRQLP